MIKEQNEDGFCSCAYCRSCDRELEIEEEVICAALDAYVELVEIKPSDPLYRMASNGHERSLAYIQHLNGQATVARRISDRIKLRGWT